MRSRQEIVNGIKEEALATADRLVAHAQNEEMVDTSYTQHGHDCLKAAETIRIAWGFFNEKMTDIQEVTNAD